MQVLCTNSDDSQVLNIVKLLNEYTNSNDLDVTLLTTYKKASLIIDNLNLSNKEAHFDAWLSDLSLQDEDVMLLTFIDENVFFEQARTTEGIVVDEGGDILIMTNEIDDELKAYHTENKKSSICLMTVEGHLEDESFPYLFKEWFTGCLR